MQFNTDYYLKDILPSIFKSASWNDLKNFAFVDKKWNDAFVHERMNRLIDSRLTYKIANNIKVGTLKDSFWSQLPSLSLMNNYRSHDDFNIDDIRHMITHFTSIYHISMKKI